MGKGNARILGPSVTTSFITGDLIVFIEGGFNHKWLKGNDILHVAGSVVLSRNSDMHLTTDPNMVVVYEPEEFFAQFRTIVALSPIAKERGIAKQN